jgi:hypothetical protein
MIRSVPDRRLSRARGSEIGGKAHAAVVRANLSRDLLALKAPGGDDRYGQFENTVFALLEVRLGIDLPDLRRNADSLPAESSVIGEEVIGVGEAPPIGFPFGPLVCSCHEPSCRFVFQPRACPPCLCFAYSHLSAVIGSILADQAGAQTRPCQYRAFSYDQDQQQRFAVSVSQGISPAPFDKARYPFSWKLGP